MPEPRRPRERWVWPWLLLFSALALYGALGRLALASLEGHREAVLEVVADALGLPLTADQLRGRMLGSPPCSSWRGFALGLLLRRG
jgi:hypothetical protein